MGKLLRRHAQGLSKSIAKMATYETAQNQFITVTGLKFAYRRLGLDHGVPLVLLMHYRGTMDHWDPALVNPLAARRPVILIDNAGVGRSGGQVPTSYAEWAQHYINVLQALNVKNADVMGFSMGGCVAQMVALNAPGLVRKLVLCGTIPSHGEGVKMADIGPFNKLKDAKTVEEHRQAFLDGMFASSERSREAGVKAWERISNARSDRSDYVDPSNSRRQGIAFMNFMNPKEAKNGSYNRFDELQMPVLIANGYDDLLLPTENSILMWKKLGKAKGQLHLYPDAGHGFLWQYAEEFSRLVNDFLDEKTENLSRL